MFKKLCIGFFPSDENPNMCDHYYEEDGTCSFLFNANDPTKPYICDDTIGINMNAHHPV